MNLKENLKQSILTYIKTKPIHYESFNIGTMLDNYKSSNIELDFIIHYDPQHSLCLTTNKTVDSRPKTLMISEVCGYLDMHLPKELTENYIIVGLPISLSYYADKLKELFNYNSECILLNEKALLEQMLNQITYLFNEQYDINNLAEILINSIDIDNKKYRVLIDGQGIFLPKDICLGFTICYVDKQLFIKPISNNIVPDNCTLSCYLFHDYLYQQMLAFKPKRPLRDTGYFIDAKETILNFEDAKLSICLSKSGSISIK